MFSAIPPTPQFPYDCSSVKSPCPQKINFHHFPLEQTWQWKKRLSFGKSLPTVKERYFSRGSPDPRQTEDCAFPVVRAGDAKRGDKVLGPMWHRTDHVCLQHCSACQGCLCLLQGSRSEHRPPALCLFNGLFCFILSAAANQHFLLCCWNSRSAGLLARKLLFPLTKPV